MRNLLIGNKRDGELKFYRGDILEVIEYGEISCV